MGVVWHTLPTLDIYSYAGLEKVDAAFRNVGTVPFGYGNPLYNNTGCNIENSPAATCNGNTSEVGNITVGFYDTIYEGLLRHGQSRRAVFLQPALRFRGRRRRTEDGRQYRHDPDPLLSLQLSGWIIDVKTRRDEANEVLLLSRVAYVVERAGLAVAGAMCGTFVAAQLTRLNPVLFNSIGFIAAMVLLG